MLRRCFRHAAVLLPLVLLCPQAAWGDLVTFAITGESTMFIDGDGDGDGVGWSIPNGTKLYGTFTFDTSTPDNNPDDPERGRYFDTIVDLSLTLGEEETSRTGIFNHIFIRTDDVNDQYILLDRALEYKGYDVSFSFLLADADASVFDDDALPVTPPPLNEFEYLGFILGGNDDEFDVNGVITSLTLVPEPSTFILLAGATLMAGRVRRRTSEVR